MMRTTKIKLPKNENKSSEEIGQEILRILKQKWSSLYGEIKIEWDVRHILMAGESSEINQLELFLGSSVYSEKDEKMYRQWHQEQEHQNNLYDA